MGSLTKDFDLYEFRQKRPLVLVPQYLVPNVLRLARQLQALRDVVGRIVITSSYRTLAHNTEIGGAPTSQHLTAKAADFIVPGVSKATIYCTILRLIKQGKMEEGGLGWYGARGHIHYDVRGFKRRWNKSSGALPVCPMIAPPEEEDEAMKAYNIEGRGPQVWGWNGKDFWRMTGDEFKEAKGLGLKTPLPKLSKTRFDAMRKRRHMD